MLKSMLMVLFVVAQCFAWGFFGRPDTVRAGVKVAAPYGVFDSLGINDTGTFACTLSYVTTTVTGIATYIKIGDFIVITFPIMEGTSNSNAFRIRGLPASLRATGYRSVPCNPYYFYNNGAYNSNPICAALESDSGYVDFYNSNSFNNWTSSGTKGIHFGTVTVMYPR